MSGSIFRGLLILIELWSMFLRTKGHTHCSHRLSMTSAFEPVSLIDTHLDWQPRTTDELPNADTALQSDLPDLPSTNAHSLRVYHAP